MSKSVCPALVKAVRGGRVRQVRLLLHSGSNPDSTGDHKLSVLSLACLLDDARGRRDITRMLSDYGADPNVLDDLGRLPLHYAALFGYHEIMALFIKDGDIDLNTRDVDGNTPLALAVLSGNCQAVRLLVDELVRYQVSVDVPDNSNVCPIMKAKFNKRKKIFFLLKRYSQLVFIEWEEPKSAGDGSVDKGNKPRQSCVLATPLDVPHTPVEWRDTKDRCLSTEHRGISSISSRQSWQSAVSMSRSETNENDARRFHSASGKAAQSNGNGLQTRSSASATTKSSGTSLAKVTSNRRGGGNLLKTQSPKASGVSTSFDAATSLMLIGANQRRPDFPNGRRVSAPFNVKQIEQKCKEANDSWLSLMQNLRPSLRQSQSREKRSTLCSVVWEAATAFKTQSALGQKPEEAAFASNKTRPYTTMVGDRESSKTATGEFKKLKKRLTNYSLGSGGSQSDKEPGRDTAMPTICLTPSTDNLTPGTTRVANEIELSPPV